MDKLVNLDPTLAEKLIKPITESFEQVLPGVKNIQSTYPMILATITIFISILFSNVVTILEINSKAYIRNLLSPANDIVFTIGLAITNFLVVMTQIFVMLLVGEFRFGISIFSNLANVLPIVMMLVIIFMLLGMCFAYITGTTQTSILLTTFLALGFFLMSNAVMPLESMPPSAASIAAFNPVVIGTNMLRQALLFHVPISLMYDQAIILLAYIAVLSAALFVISKRRNKQKF
jgi:ABC-type polysaccharide/polyol phosphate export permease